MAVLVLKKAVRVLEALGAAGRPVGLAELCREIELPKPTVYRILTSFAELGYVARDRASGSYVPTSRLAQLGRAGRGFDLKRRALPFMERLHRRFNETVNLGVLEGADVHYLHVLETTRALRLMVRPGSTDPFYSTALGRAIVAHLPEREREELLRRAKIEPRTPATVRDAPALRRILRDTRERGWALDDEENDGGVACLGVPLLEGAYPIGALSVTVPKARLARGREREIVRELLRARLREPRASSS